MRHALLGFVSGLVLLTTFGVQAAPPQVIGDVNYRLDLVSVPSGLLVDFGKLKNARRADQVNLTRGGEDLTEKARYLRPLVEVMVEMADFDPASQCKTKALLDVIVGPRVVAYTSLPNAFCDELNFQTIGGHLARSNEKTAAYTRKLVIRISGGPDQYTGQLSGFANLDLMLAEFSDPRVISNKIAAFLRRGSTGAFVYVPKALLNSLDPLLLQVVNESEAVTYFRIAGGLTPLRLSLMEVSAVAFSLLVILYIFIRLRRRDKPVRSLLVGYGNVGDVTLGPGDDTLVARLALYKGSRICIEPLSQRHEIRVNDKRLKRKTWANPGDKLQIDGKQVQLT